MIDTRWRKSTRSGNGECVEVRRVGDTVQVRDSKDPTGPVLSFNRAEWIAFICGVTSNEFHA